MDNYIALHVRVTYWIVGLERGIRILQSKKSCSNEILKIASVSFSK